MALIAALVTTRIDDVTQADAGLVGRALVDLSARGFDIKEAQSMLRRLRNRLVDLADRAGEPGKNTGPAMRFAGEAIRAFACNRFITR